MSFVMVLPEFVDQAAGQLENIGSALTAANATAAVPTTNVVAAAGDEVSAAIASLFSSQAQEFLAHNARAAAFHNQFTHTRTAAADAFAGAEAAGASRLGQLLTAVDAATGLLAGVAPPAPRTWR